MREHQTIDFCSAGIISLSSPALSKWHDRTSAVQWYVSCSISIHTLDTWASSAVREKSNHKFYKVKHQVANWKKEHLILTAVLFALMISVLSYYDQPFCRDGKS